MADAILTAERLREVLHYDSETGAFTWNIALSNRAPVGTAAGSKSRHTGYTSISVDGALFRAHRLAWLYMTGEWPERFVDHINGDRSDNRWCNLRAADGTLNQQNLRAARGDTHSGMLGVYRTDKKSSPWRASINIDGKDKHLGNFATKEDAHRAYLDAKRAEHQGCTI